MITMQTTTYILLQQFFYLRKKFLMKFRGIGVIKHLRFEKAKDFVLVEGFYIGYNIEHIRSFFEADKRTLLEVGTRNYGAFAEATALISAKIEHESTIGWSIIDEVGFTVRIYSGQMYPILHALWLIKDNSATCDMFYARAEKSHEVMWNFRNSFNSNAQGLYNTTSFTKDELNWLPYYCNLMRHYLMGDQLENLKAWYSQLLSQTSYEALVNHIPYGKNVSRITKAIWFIFRARTSSFLPLKISFYIIMLESLFNTGSDIIKKSVAYRTAFYFNDEENTYPIYKAVSSGYKVRSQFLHGLSLEKAQISIPKLQSISTELDLTVRKCIIRAMENHEELFAKPTEERLAFFAEIVKYNFSYNQKNKIYKVYRNEVQNFIS